MRKLNKSELKRVYGAGHKGGADNGDGFEDISVGGTAPDDPTDVVTDGPGE